MGSTLTVLDVVVGNRDPVKNAKWLKKEQEEGGGGGEADGSLFQSVVASLY